MPYALSIVLIVLLAVLAIIYWQYHFLKTQQHLESERVDAFKQDMASLRERMIDEFDHLGKQAVVLAEQPDIRKLSLFYRKNSRTESGTSPRLVENYFIKLLQADRNYLQLRLISLGNGREFVRVERRLDEPTVVFRTNGKALQYKGNRPYVLESQKLYRGEFYLSDIEPNVEYGRITEPKTLVIRAAAPVYDRNGVPVAIVVINYLIDSFLQQLTRAIPDEYQLSVFGRDFKQLVASRNRTIFDAGQVRQSLQQLNNRQDKLMRHPEQGWLSYQTRVQSSGQNRQSFYLIGSVPLQIILPEGVVSPYSVYTLVLAVLLILMITILRLRFYYLKLQDKLQRQVRNFQGSNAKHQAILKTALDSIITIDDQGIIESVNPATEQLFGYTDAEMIGNNISMLMPEPFRKHHNSYIQNYKKSDMPSVIGVAGREVMGMRKDGSVFPMELGVSLTMVGTDKKFTGIIRDISERKDYEARIERQAYFDSLTKLPNRHYIADKLKQVLSHANRHRIYGAVMFVDLDRFKQVNDTYGHHVGDKLLVEVAERLSGAIREEDLVGRIGGDEFVIILSELSREEHEATNTAQQIASKLKSIIDKDYIIENKTCRVGASIGITLYPAKNIDAQTLIGEADMAMYAAKESGRDNIRIFSKGMSNEVEDRLSLEERLRTAFEKDHFHVLYQPLVDASQKVIGAEALLRMTTEDGKTYMPEEFIPVAEFSSLITELSDFVLDAALRDLQQWQKSCEYLDDFRLSVNLSPLQLFHPNLFSSITEKLHGYSITPGNLVLEITEGVAIHDFNEARRILKILAQSGIRIAIDDFGTGYASLNYLRQLPIHELKIDRSLIQNMTSNDNEMAIVSSIIALAKNMQLEVVAEGVEQHVEFELLQQLECQYFQGFFCHKPLTAEELERLISGDRSSAVILPMH